MVRVRLLVFAAIMAATMLATSAAPAWAEYIQQPLTGEYWWCDYYYDGGVYSGYSYWCYVESSGQWFMARPGWQYGPLGG